MTAEPFHVGELVDVKQHGRAWVTEVVSDPSQPHCGRVLVRYEEDGTTFYCNPKKLRKLRPSSRQVVVCYRTEHYRAAAVHNVERQDVCLEVGCHTGTTTRILFNRCSHVVGVDNVALAVDQAREKHPDIRFELVDGFDIDQVRALSPSGTFSKVFVDLSGKAPLHLISRFLALYLKAFPHTTIVVKNEALFGYLEQLEQQQHGQAPQQSEQQAQRPEPAWQQQEHSEHGAQHRQRQQHSQQRHEQWPSQQQRQQQPGQQQHEPWPSEQEPQLGSEAGCQGGTAVVSRCQDEGGQGACLPAASPGGAATAASGALPSGLADLCELFRWAGGLATL
ncbi:hypothetical protein N2152v2_001660 [Parachlorella kessleri]